ncbi:hypothetical protein [Psychrobacillus sp. FJAT-21963]|uniref:hypothetical protein n=1 Tax=Psychrobacillus sp. FJAT-21963 TaxID=1712028 RepID=UPI0006F77F5B|nr:hypothetical protein [Psychrobacillus sp. FJAT-21963]KQL35591.1 hypothetical protein AN959_06740 [Psychrobacillus sp. FJAT-21963]
MNDFKILHVLDNFKRLFQKFDIDYEVMRTILQLKLMMDSRRMPTVFSGSKVKKEGNQFLKSLWFYALIGLFLLTPFLFLGSQYIFLMSIMFSLVMFILMTSMISDFSGVLLDIRDKNILHTKPISLKTLNAAKIVHIMIYMFLLTGSFVGLPFLVSIFKHGIWFGLIFLTEIILISCFVVVLTAFVYLIILRFFSGEKLKDIINYVQIILTIALTISYQLVARSFEIINMKISYTFEWWHILLFPIWYGAPFELFLNKDFSFHIILMSLFALFTPIFSVWLYVRLMPAFERNLGKLLSDSTRKRKAFKLDRIWAKIVCRTEEERTFYRFSSLMMKQERELKLKIYPQLGFGFIFPLIFLANDISMKSIEETMEGNIFLVIYFSVMIIPTIVHMLQFSSNAKGHWIYRAAPLQNELSIYSGTLKACIVNYFLPIFVSLSVLFIVLFSVRIVPDLFVVLLVGIAMTLISYRMLNGEVFPFSKLHEHAQDAGTLKVFISLIFIGLFVLAHVIVSKIPYGLFGYMVVLIVGIIFGWSVTFSKHTKKR